MHDLQRIVEVTLSPTAQFENVVQPLDLVRGDCNTLRIYVDGLADNSLLYVRFTNGFSCDTYGDTYAAQSDVQTDGEKTYIDVPVPQNKVLWNKSKMQVIASIEKNGCKITTPTTADISTVPDRIINEFLGETGTVTFAQLEAASETATQAAASATSAANAASATATAIAQAAERGDYNGAGIADIQFTETDEQGGNIYTITLTNGDTYTFIAPKGDGDTGGGGSGADGKSAYEIAVDNGFVGTVQEWLASLKGTDGHTPAKGVDYWTAADRTEIISELENVIPNAYDDTAIKARVSAIESKESTWDAKSNFSGSYNDLSDKPTIPTVPTSEISANTSARHTHSNKAILDQIDHIPLDGHTPVKGTDYWTASDKASMVQDVLAALPTWQGGSY